MTRKKAAHAKRPGTGKGNKQGQRRTRYTDADRIAFLTLLESNGGNLLKTATESGIPYMTCQSWASGSRHPEARVIQQRHKGDLIAAVRETLWQTLDVVSDPEKLRKAPLGQATQALNTVFGIVRSLEGYAHGGQADSTTPAPLDLRNLSPDELRTFITLCAKLQSATGGAVGPVGIGPRVLPPLCPAVLPDDEPDPAVHRGRSDGRDSGPLASGEGRADRATTNSDPAGYA